MALTIGTRLGPYEILAAIDTRLKRQVAIKILPASLNRPNIAQIYGLEDADGVKALVMELVEGEDLSQRLAHGAVPLAEAI